MNIIYIIANSVLYLLSFPAAWLDIALPKNTFISILAIIIFFAIPVIITYCFVIIKRFRNRHFIQSLNSQDYLKKVSKEINHKDGTKQLKDSFLYPSIKYTKDYIKISPINSSKTEDKIKNDLKYFSELFRVKITNAAKLNYSHLFGFYKYDSLLLYKDNLPKLFHLNEVKLISPFSLCLGINNNKEQRYWNIQDHPAILITGVMKSGKSVLINALTLQLIKNLKDSQVYIFTGKRPDEDFPNLINHPRIHLFCHQNEEGLIKLKETINYAKNEYQNTQADLLAKSNLKKWYELPSPNPLLLIIDEAFLLSGKENKEMMIEFMKAVSLGRSRGLLTIIGTQGQDASEFSDIGIKRDRFTLMIGSKTPTPQLSQTLYQNQQIGIDPSLSMGKMILKGHADPEIIKAVYADDVQASSFQKTDLKSIKQELPEASTEDASKDIAAKDDASRAMDDNMKAPAAREQTQEFIKESLPFKIIQSSPDGKNPQRSKYEIEFEGKFLTIYANTDAANSELLSHFLKKASK